MKFVSIIYIYLESYKMILFFINLVELEIVYLKFTTTNRISRDTLTEAIKKHLSSEIHSNF